MAIDFHSELKELEACEPLRQHHTLNCSQSDWLFVASRYWRSSSDPPPLSAPSDSALLSPRPSALFPLSSPLGGGGRAHDDCMLIAFDVSSSSVASLEEPPLRSPAAAAAAAGAAARVALAKRRAAKKRDAPASKGARHLHQPQPAAPPTGPGAPAAAAAAAGGGGGGPQAGGPRRRSLGAAPDQRHRRGDPRRAQGLAPLYAMLPRAAAAARSRSGGPLLAAPAVPRGREQEEPQQPQEQQEELGLFLQRQGPRPRSGSRTTVAARSPDVVVSPASSVERVAPSRIAGKGKRHSACRRLSDGVDVVEVTEVTPLGDEQHTVTHRLDPYAYSACDWTDMKSVDGPTAPLSDDEDFVFDGPKAKAQEEVEEEEKRNARTEQQVEKMEEEKTKEEKKEEKEETKEENKKKEEQSKQRREKEAEEISKNGEIEKEPERLSITMKGTDAAPENGIMLSTDGTQGNGIPHSSEISQHQLREAATVYQRRYAKHAANKKCCAVM